MIKLIIRNIEIKLFITAFIFYFPYKLLYSVIFRAIHLFVYFKFFSIMAYFVEFLLEFNYFLFGFFSSINA